jgi:hypothetical protein
MAHPQAWAKNGNFPDADFDEFVDWSNFEHSIDYAGLLLLTLTLRRWLEIG